MTNNQNLPISTKSKRRLTSRRLLRRPRETHRPPRRPRLRFCPAAWAKLLFLRDEGPTEVGGFAITADDDLLCIEDVELVRQCCTLASVAFDDESVAEFFDRQVDTGHKPEQFARIWVHTHPGSSAEPSSVDEATFRRVFGRCDWAVMFILSQTGQTYCRIRFRTGPGGSFEIPVEVDFHRPFQGTDWEAWKQEYLASVVPVTWEFATGSKLNNSAGGRSDGDCAARAVGDARADDLEPFELKEFSFE
jgi:proteasome lid subunit RPN8/RPN11